MHLPPYPQPTLECRRGLWKHLLWSAEKLGKVTWQCPAMWDCSDCSCCCYRCLYSDAHRTVRMDRFSIALRSRCVLHPAVDSKLTSTVSHSCHDCTQMESGARMAAPVSASTKCAWWCTQTYHQLLAWCCTTYQHRSLHSTQSLWSSLLVAIIFLFPAQSCPLKRIHSFYRSHFFSPSSHSYLVLTRNSLPYQSTESHPLTIQVSPCLLIVILTKPQKNIQNETHLNVICLGAYFNGLAR